MSGDPFAAIAEPAQGADPFAAIAEGGNTSATPAPTSPAPPAPRHNMFAWQDKADDKIGEFMTPITGEEIRKQQDAGAIPRTPLISRKTDERIRTEGANFSSRVLGDMANAAVHPVKTAAGIYGMGKEMVTHPPPIFSGNAAMEKWRAEDNGPISEQVHNFQEAYKINPHEAVRNLSGDLLAMYLSGKLLDYAGRPVIAGVKNLAPPAARGAADAVAGTGPRVTKALVNDTQAANVADAAKVGEDNSIAALKAEAKRRAELKEHAEAKSTVEAKNQAVKAKLESDLAAQRKIAPTEQKLGNARSATRAAIETAREKALKVGNEKYTTVRDALNSIEARPDFANDLDVLATQNIPGSKGAPTILKAIAKRAASQEPIRYEDLQADYSTLGNELSKGTLDGTTYHAYDQMHEAIGKEMQGIADENGMGEQLTAARDYWRRMKQTFGKPISFTDAASKTLGGLKDETQENQIRLLGSFDPEIPKLFNHVSNIEKGVEAQPKPVPERVLTTKAAESRVAPPKLDLTPRPDPKLPAPRKVGPEDVQAAKAEAVAKRADTFRNRGGGLASTFLVLDGIRNAFHGNVAAIGEDIGARAAFGVAKQSAARLLENPKVANWLSQATPRDVAQIPADLRGDFPNLVKAAQAKGIKVSPALLGIAAVSGLPAPRAKHPTDVY